MLTFATTFSRNWHIVFPPESTVIYDKLHLEWVFSQKLHAFYWCMCYHRDEVSGRTLIHLLACWDHPIRLSAIRDCFPSSYCVPVLGSVETNRAAFIEGASTFDEFGKIAD